jgi:hypothetical protein
MKRYRVTDCLFAGNDVFTASWLAGDPVVFMKIGLYSVDPSAPEAA